MPAIGRIRVFASTLPCLGNAVAFQGTQSKSFSQRLPCREDLGEKKKFDVSGCSDNFTRSGLLQAGMALPSDR